MSDSVCVTALCARAYLVLAIACMCVAVWLCVALCGCV